MKIEGQEDDFAFQSAAMFSVTLLKDLPTHVDFHAPDAPPKNQPSSIR